MGGKVILHGSADDLEGMQWLRSEKIRKLRALVLAALCLHLAIEFKGR
jgi:hypothetical protein